MLDKIVELLAEYEALKAEVAELRKVLGICGPALRTKATCARCGEHLRHESDWWATDDLTGRYGSITCPDGAYHVEARNG